MIRTTANQASRLAIIGIIMASLSSTGCARLISQQASKFADGLTQAIRAQNDLATVEAGAPAYLLLLEAMLQNDPDSPSTLLGAANLYSFYAGVFVSEPERQKRLSSKALNYAMRGSCGKHSNLCDLNKIPLNTFSKTLQGFDKDDVADLYTLGTIWAGWLQSNTSDWNAIAKLGHIKALMERTIELDESYDNGSAHLYLGVLNTLLPAAMGGQPEKGRSHFEKALDLSEGKNQLVKVYYAKHYARLIFDQALHNRLLTEVTTTKIDAPEFTLINQLAQKEASELLADEADYF